MADYQASLEAIYEGWHTYQQILSRALAPLTAEQLELRAAPHLRSIDEIARHMVGARARWFHRLLGEGGDEFAALGQWDRSTMPSRSAAELIDGLERTWQGMHQAIARWTPEQWQETYPGEDETEPQAITRQWVIWHLVEHDLHHGGEISLTLGAHGVPALDM
jgi:uncharacterized damage-inducible protein DinB